MPEIRNRMDDEIRSFIEKIDAGTATRDDVKSLGWAGVEHDVEFGHMSKDNGTLPAYLEQLEKIVLHSIADNRKFLHAGITAEINNDTQLLEIAGIVDLALQAEKRLVAERDAARKESEDARKRLKYLVDALYDNDMLRTGCNVSVDTEHRVKIVLGHGDPGGLVKLPTNQEMDQFDAYCSSAKAGMNFDEHFLKTEWGQWLSKNRKLK